MHRDQPDRLSSGDQAALFKRIRDLVLAARKTVARGVDLVQVQTCFQIGRNIVEQEQAGEERAAYGQEILKPLADRLTAEFGRGFSRANLEYMRKFFLSYRDHGPIAQSPTGKSFPCPFTLSWTHYVFLIGIDNPDERRFYEIEATYQDWSVRELKRQFDSSLYERLALSRDKEGIRQLARRGQVVDQPQDILKEPLVLEFLGLGEQQRFSESELERAIISRIEQFLLELGKGFLFEARQKRFTLGDDHFYVDLVFYNRLLRC